MPNDNNGHSFYGASAASRWRTCAGSVRVIREARASGKIPTESTSVYADEGTKAHDWATKVLTDKISIGEVPDEFRHHLIGYVAHCRAAEAVAIKTAGDETVVVFNEERVPLFYRPMDHGTVDHAVVAPSFIHVSDLKYGAGVKVDAEDNDQAQIYAISLIQELEIMGGQTFVNDMPVFLTIYQPRHFTFTGEPDTWETTVGDLRDIATSLEADYTAAKEAETGDLTPSEKGCMFCPARGVCAVRAKTNFAGFPPVLNVNEDFDIEEGKKDVPKKFDRDTLTTEEIAWVCRNANTIKKVVDDVVKAEIERLKTGGEIQGMKLVAGRLGNRTWVDDKAAETFVRGILGVADAYQPRKLISASQAVAKAKGIIGDLSTVAKLKLGLVEDENTKTKSLIHRPAGSPKLVSVDDKGEALTFNAADDFDTVD